MKPANLALITVAALVLIGGALYFLSNPDRSSEDTATQSTTENTQSETQSNDVPQPDTSMTYTTQEVSMHNQEDDCWTIIEGSVYDITSYVPRHPGGDEILRACGEDGTTLFTQRTTESGEEVGSGTPHSSSAENQLARLKIGQLAN